MGDSFHALKGVEQGSLLAQTEDQLMGKCIPKIDVVGIKNTSAEWQQPLRLPRFREFDL